MEKRVLLAGESWMCTTYHIKGFDSFCTSKYEEGATALIKVIELAGYKVDYYPNHIANERLPYTLEEYKQYDVVILSDIGSNTLLIPDTTFSKGEKHPNRCEAIRDYVLQGGSFLMIGGYMSFCGIDAKTRYGSTEISEILPVRCLDIDDRVERPEGMVPKKESEHALCSGLDGEWPALLGYNKTLAREDCPVLVLINDDPLLAIGEFGKGRSAVFTSDCAPHWGPKEFMEWQGYPTLWKNILSYLIKND